MSRPSQLQLEKLVEFLESNRGIAKGILRSAHGRREVKRKWEDLAPSLNSMNGAVKDARGWAKFWADKKFAIKKAAARRNASVNLTGGDSIQPLSDLEERLVSLIGGTSNVEGSQESSDPLVSVVLEKPTIRIPEGEVVVVKDEATSESESLECLSDKSQESYSSSPQPSLRKSKRVHRNKLSIERERLIRVEEKRAEAELANAAGWTKLVQAIDNLANAIIFSGNKIAEALEKHK